MIDRGPIVPRLQVIDQDGTRRLVPITKRIFEIGRRTASDLALMGTDISREHATIIEEGDRFRIEDRRSRCGTFVNGQQISTQVLTHGDRIEFGQRGGAHVIFLTQADSSGLLGSRGSGIVDFHTIAGLLDGLRALGGSQVLDEVLALVMDSAIEVTGAERGFIMLANAEGHLEFTIGRMRDRSSLPGRSFATSQKIPAEVFATGRAQMLADLFDDTLAGQHAGTVALGIRHVLCVPLRVVHFLDAKGDAEEDKRIGVLYLDSPEKGHLLSAATRKTLEAVSVQASVAIESARLYREATEKRRLDRELQLAADIQRALLPEPHYQAAAFEVAAASIPCRAIGGDFFDYFQLPDDEFGLALGDVAGKGPSAALLTAMIQGVLSSHVHAEQSPAAMMTLINQSLIRRCVQSRFATLVYGRLAPGGRLTYSNAGHNPPMLVRADGVQRLATGGLILGLFPHATHDEEMVWLKPGDLLVIVSDGVTEALSATGEEFGEARLLECVIAHQQQPPTELLDALLSSVRRFAADAAQHDDVTAMVLRYRG